MAVQVVMPKQGNSVESCVILEWKKGEGDTVAVGEVLCEAETDKSTIEVESTAQGIVLKLLYGVGEEVPVQQPIAIVGKAGERLDAPQEAPSGGVSPRARAAAHAVAVDLGTVIGSGAKGRVIERDVLAVASSHEPLSPAALDKVRDTQATVPASGTGIGGRIVLADLDTPASPAIQKINSDAAPKVADFPGALLEKQLKSVRKVIAKRMRDSLSTTAQLTLNAYADATALKSLRARLKGSDESLGLRNVTINDLVLFAVSRTLPLFPSLNSHFLGDVWREFEHVHLGCAVDTPKGLLVPVVRFADTLSLAQLSAEFKRLSSAAIDGKASPDDLSGGTFTVTNLGSLGIDTFTPVLNTPEVGILGVGGISSRPVEDEEGDIAFIPHIALSLTIDHQVVDGAPGARFLKALCTNIASIDVLLAR